LRPKPNVSPKQSPWLGLIERLTKNADPVCTREKAKKKKKIVYSKIKFPFASLSSQLFDKCLAPDSLGDGTGCDNMTCVLVKIEPGRLSRDNAAPSDCAAPISVASAKRSREDTEAAANPSKKSKTEEGEVSSVTDV
jgi:hypothetical protein